MKRKYFVGGVVSLGVGTVPEVSRNGFNTPALPSITIPRGETHEA